jgi:hypothetical protein
MPTRPESRCHDCGAIEGQLHQRGCDMERCPFCGGQLISCDCAYENLGLRDLSRYTTATAYLPPHIYQQGLSAAQQAKWEARLRRKGRVPFIVYPVLCAKCGTLWPEFFRVPDAEWERYIQMDMRDAVLCRPCFEYIKQVIDAAATQRSAGQRHVGQGRK